MIALEGDVAGVGGCGTKMIGSTLEETRQRLLVSTETETELEERERRS
jgi:hypothetical protein